MDKPYRKKEKENSSPRKYDSCKGLIFEIHKMIDK